MEKRSSLRATLAVTKSARSRRSVAGRGARQDAGGDQGYSAKLTLSEETLRGLKGKHGTELEQWWVAAFGYGFERLTESEARYLTRADDAHSISARIVAAARICAKAKQNSRLKRIVFSTCFRRWQRIGKK